MKFEKKRFLLPLHFLLTATCFASPPHRVFSSLTKNLGSSRRLPETDCFSFAVIGDNQPKGTFGQPEVFKKILEEVNESGVEFAVHLGDKISGSQDEKTVKKQYEEFFNTLAILKVKIYHTPGNHDVKGMGSSRELYRELFGEPYYSFSHKNAFFIVLNTEIAGEEGAVEGKQMEWLKSELEKAENYRDSFIFIHRPLFSAIFPGKDHVHFKSAGERDRLASLLTEHNVKAVFAGHEHLYHAGNFKGLHQVISGGGGAPFHFFPAGNFYHYLIVSITEDYVRIEAVPVKAE